MDFTVLSEFEQMLILIQADNKDFEKYLEFIPIPDINIERIYKERVERLFHSDLITFKPQDKSWKEFYYILNEFIDDIHDPANHKPHLFLYYITNNNLLELQLFKEVYPEVFYLHLKEMINTAIFKAKTTIAKWLLGFVDDADDYMQYNIDVLNIIDSYRFAEYDFIEFLISHGFLPTATNIRALVHRGRLDLLKKLSKYSLHYITANDAVEFEKLKILKWLAENKVLPQRHKIRMALHNSDDNNDDSYLILRFMIDNKIYPTVDEINEYASPEDKSWLIENSYYT